MDVRQDWDAIVVGSGITGGWAAKELTERGLRVLMLERGPAVEHARDYPTEHVPPWDFPYRGRGNPREMAEDYPIQSIAPGCGEDSKGNGGTDDSSRRGQAHYGTPHPIGLPGTSGDAASSAPIGRMEEKSRGKASPSRAVDSRCRPHSARICRTLHAGASTKWPGQRAFFQPSFSW